MIDKTPISSIMSTNLVTVDVSESIVNAEKLFKKNGIKHIPVLKNKEIVGMLSYSDILRVSFSNVPEGEEKVHSEVYNIFTIEQVMEKNVFMVPPNSSIREVARLLEKQEFHALPIIEDNELVGIITTRDLIKYLVNEF